MDRGKFSEMLASLTDLTFEQRKALSEELEKASGDQQVRTVVEEKVKQCPYCESADLGRWGQSHGLSRFRCRNCGKTFNALTGTPLARLRLKDRWMTFAKTLLDGESVRKSAETCAVHKSTTFRWRHRFLTLPSELKARVLNGIAEADETFLLHSRKGQRQLDRPARKRGGKASKPGRSDEHVCVFVARDRAGATVDHVSATFDKKVIAQAIKPVLAKDAILCSDGLPSYKAFCRENGVVHKPLNLSEGVRVVEDVFHIQNVNAYHSRFKGWLRPFHGVATRYLPNYVGWFRWIDRTRSAPSVTAVMAAAAGVSQQLMVT